MDYEPITDHEFDHIIRQHTHYAPGWWERIMRAIAAVIGRLVRYR